MKPTPLKPNKTLGNTKSFKWKETDLSERKKENKIENKLPKMENIKGVLLILLGCLASFILGLYASTEIKTNIDIPWYRWIFTSVFGLFFLSEGINKLMKK
jgi:undecaprenyl pyrophosphate phosphatase UppP